MKKFILTIFIILVLGLIGYVLVKGIEIGNFKIKPILNITINNQNNNQQENNKQETKDNKSEFLSEDELKKIAKEYLKDKITNRYWKKKLGVVYLSEGIVSSMLIDPYDKNSQEDVNHAKVIFSVNTKSEYDYEKLTERTIGSANVVIDRRNGSVVKSEVNEYQY